MHHSRDSWSRFYINIKLRLNTLTKSYQVSCFLCWINHFCMYLYNINKLLPNLWPVFGAWCTIENHCSTGWSVCLVKVKLNASVSECVIVFEQDKVRELGRGSFPRDALPQSFLVFDRRAAVDSERVVFRSRFIWSLTVSLHRVHICRSLKTD